MYTHKKRKIHHLRISFYLGKFHLVKLPWRKDKRWQTNWPILGAVLQDKWTLFPWVQAQCYNLTDPRHSASEGPAGPSISQMTFLYGQLDKRNSHLQLFLYCFISNLILSSRIVSCLLMCCWEFAFRLLGNGVRGMNCSLVESWQCNHCIVNATANKET